MRYETLIMSVTILLGMCSSAYAQRQPIDGDWNSPKCIEAIWELTNPTNEQKEFDIENDPDLMGSRFSCYSQISPTEINQLLNQVKDAIANDNKEKLANFVVYPFDYWVKTENHPVFGERAPGIATNRQEFVEQYDDIITADVKKIMNCATISKMRNNGEGSVFVAHGYILFVKEPDNNKEIVRDFQNYPLRVSLIGSYFDRTENWFQTHCQ